MFMSTLSQSPLWDPLAAFNAYHLDGNEFRCIGWASSQNRRCLNQISITKRRPILNKIEKIHKNKPEQIAIEKLHEVLSVCLCHCHKYQVMQCIQLWTTAVGGRKRLERIPDQTKRTAHHKSRNNLTPAAITRFTQLSELTTKRKTCVGRIWPHNKP